MFFGPGVETPTVSGAVVLYHTEKVELYETRAAKRDPFSTLKMVLLNLRKDNEEMYDRVMTALEDPERVEKFKEIMNPVKIDVETMQESRGIIGSSYATTKRA